VRAGRDAEIGVNPPFVAHLVAAVGDVVGPRARIRFHLHQWRVAFDLVGKTDLLAFMPERLVASGAGEYGAVVLRQFPPVFSSDLSVTWRATQTNEPGNRGLRNLIVKSVGQTADAV